MDNKAGHGHHHHDISGELLELLSRGHSTQELRDFLSGKGLDDDVSERLIKQAKTIRMIKSRKTGMVLLAIGSIFLLGGFIVTAVLFHSGTSVNYAMYTLTTIGILLLMIGLVKVMGW
ncbi:MAG: hypothetical protein FD123_4386 [Bacteroidetes bacterium]|nr:MAG: hypothetical protein FD123_4386 [Bacteroidota bacterium]